MNEIGGEVACFDALADFLASPETPFFHFVVVNVDVVMLPANENVYQFAFPLGFPDIGGKGLRRELPDAQFLAGFAVQGFFRRFADSDVPANGSIPFAGEEFLCPAAFLEKNAAVPVGDMQVYYGMQQPACSVAFAPWRFADNLPLFVDKGKPFLGGDFWGVLVVFHVVKLLDANPLTACFCVFACKFPSSKFTARKHNALGT